MFGLTGLGIGAFKQRLPREGEALSGRPTPLPLDNLHHVLGTPLRGEFPGMQRAWFGMGCFWGAERLFWSVPGVVSTSVGYAGGSTPNPTYRETCSGQTGHAEVVQVVYDPTIVSFDSLLRHFWEGHDPTQGMRQGNDSGTQYRSVILCDTQAQYDAAIATRDAYQKPLRQAGIGAITTQVEFPALPFFYAENEHQQYLSKNPRGYCGIGGTGVSCPVGIGA